MSAGWLDVHCRECDSILKSLFGSMTKRVKITSGVVGPFPPGLILPGQSPINIQKKRNKRKRTRKRRRKVTKQNRWRKDCCVQRCWCALAFVAAAILSTLRTALHVHGAWCVQRCRFAPAFVAAAIMSTLRSVLHRATLRCCRDLLEMENV